MAGAGKLEAKAGAKAGSKAETGRNAVAARRRVAFVAADAADLIRFRCRLLEAIAARGHQILCFTANAKPADVDTLKALGAAHCLFPMKQGGLRALADRSATARLRALLTEWGPNVVLGIGLKPMVMAAIATRRLDVTRTVLVATSLTGLTLKGQERLPFGVRWLLRQALENADALVVFNAGDEETLGKLGLLPDDLTVRVQPGSGVDLARFAPQPMPDVAGGVVFTMIEHGDRAKGMANYIEAARITKARVPKARFVLATSEVANGELRTGIDPIGRPEVVELASAADTLALLASTHVFVQPSSSEGFAQGVAEALACGRPAITSDIAGCREIVDERVSGVLVPPEDVIALGRAIDSFLRRPEDIAWMGQAARRKAERRFDVRVINAELLDLMELAGEAAQ